jgi:tRNA threonylcarbamoyladenosine biosynthesis protein TsaE
MTRLVTRSPQETFDLGKTFSRQLKPGDVVALIGNLGSGKTHFVAGVCEGLGVQVHATSPTFTLINEYDGIACKVVHIDLYRINKLSELREVGIEEYFDTTCICLIEWAEMISAMLPEKHFTVRLEHGGTDTERLISIDELVAV